MNPADGPFKLREIWPPGTVIKGDYIVEKRLGSGGFGTVYLARHRFLATLHVIKRLHEQYASDEEYVRKFVNEGRAVRRLKACPNIVEVEHMTQSEDGHLIMVMEYVAGGDLFGLMERRTLAIPEIIEYGRQIAVALEAAHQAGLIHRDIKPQNVMVSQDSTGKTLLKLIDFGIAADHVSQTQTSVARRGSIGYAAPEQWIRAGKSLDGRADLYSLGVTLYKMLTGRMPYEDAYDVGGWIEQVNAGPPVAPMLLRPETPAPLSELTMEMLAFRPESRPAEAGIVAARLAAMQTQQAIPPPPPPIFIAPPPRVETRQEPRATAVPTMLESPRPYVPPTRIEQRPSPTQAMAPPPAWGPPPMHPPMPPAASLVSMSVPPGYVPTLPLEEPPLLGTLAVALGPLLAITIALPMRQFHEARISLAALLIIAVLGWFGGWNKIRSSHVPRTAPPLPPGQVTRAIAVLIVLILSKYFYLATLTTYFRVYLYIYFHLVTSSAEIFLFEFLGAVAIGTLIGGPASGWIGRKAIIWLSVLGVLPLSLTLPHMDLFWTQVLSLSAGFVIALGFAAILSYAQELVPGRLGMISGLFFWLALGIGGIAAVGLGWLSRLMGFEFVNQVAAFVPAIGLCTIFLPNLGVYKLEATSSAVRSGMEPWR